MQPDDLYGLALDRFVPERAALAKSLRGDGRRAEAAGVASMRKPSVAAWAVNQLVRTQRKALQELFGAGDALRDTQADLLAGRGDARALRDAGERERAAVERLLEKARGLLTSEGQTLSSAVVERVADTLHAAALDEDAREQVHEGRLERELRHAGLGLGESLAAPSTLAPRERKGKGKGKAPTSKRAVRQSTKAARDDERARTAQQRAGSASSASRQPRARPPARPRRRRGAEPSAPTMPYAPLRSVASEPRALEEADAALAAARGDSKAAAEAQRRAQTDLERAQGM